jgi:hypothetical protein
MVETKLQKAKQVQRGEKKKVKCSKVVITCPSVQSRHKIIAERDEDSMSKDVGSSNKQLFNFT